MSLAGRIGRSLAWLRRSSALRLSLLLSGVFAAAMVGAIFIALDLGESALERRIDRTLEVMASTAVLDGRGPLDTFSVILRSPAHLGDLPPSFARVVRRGGGTVNLEDPFRRSETWRILVTRDRRGVPLLVGVPLDDSEAALELLAGIQWTMAMAVAGLTVLIGFGAGLVAQRRFARINATLNRLAAGDLTARTGIARGRDDLDDIARELDRAAAELERLVAQTRHLSASLAHDLRTPLARLRARLEMLPEGEAREAALDEASALSGMFDTIMRVARIEAGQGTDGFVQVDLGALARDVAETFGPVIDDADKALTLDVAAPETVLADRNMLVQALANLIQNALVHGGPEITLSARGRAIGVSDNGRGVPPEHHAEIIKPLVRLDSARTSEGTGLGLALVRAVADRHGAELALSEARPQGLRVMLKFANL